MFIEKANPKKRKPRRGGMKILIDDCSCLPAGTATQLRSAEEWNGEKLN
ncbi:MAG: hypothetical protein K8R79_10620 [Calditrichales bacterium]|nr:hypothetical protein [Calditrichales bacterium]